MKPGLSMLLATLALAWYAGAAAAQTPSGAGTNGAQHPSMARKPAAPAHEASPTREAPGVARETPTAWWYDHGVRRPLHLDRNLVADFAGEAPAATRRGKSRSPLRPRDAEKDSGSLPAGASPVFRDAGGAPRALPGGVIVRLHDAQLRDARERLAAAGLTPVRPIDPQGRVWLVESAPGLPALELANRLHETGEFESAEPNWWRPRVLK